MLIKSLKLINFQKHSDLQIDFCNGVNILYGSSDAGKSCIRRALEWICQNENFDGIRKTGTKKTIVTLTLDNNIEIERVKSTSINRYIIRENEKEQIFDAIGKSIPDEVKEKLTIYPIEVDGEEIYLNSQPQIALPFLFDKSPSFRMKLFNKLTGNDVLDKLFGQFNKDILRIKRGYKEEVERLENRAMELKEKEIQKEKAEAIHSRLSTRIKNLKNIYEKYSKLLKLKELSDANNEQFLDTNLKLKSLKFSEDIVIKQLNVNINRFEQLKTVKNSSEKVKAGLDRVRGQLKDFRSATLDISSLSGKIERYTNLKSLKEKFDNNKDICHTYIRDIKIIEKDTIKCMDLYKTLLKEAKICPICQNEVTEECLKGIKL